MEECAVNQQGADGHEEDMLEDVGTTGPVQEGKQGLRSRRVDFLMWI